jgi:hypothetical protein
MVPICTPFIKEPYLDFGEIMAGAPMIEGAKTTPEAMEALVVRKRRLDSEDFCLLIIIFVI